MFDKCAFLEKVAQANKTVKSLADAIGLQPAALSRKINGRSEFTYAEIQKICNALALRPPEAEAIFFAKELTETQDKRDSREKVDLKYAEIVNCRAR